MLNIWSRPRTAIRREDRISPVRWRTEVATKLAHDRLRGAFFTIRPTMTNLNLSIASTLPPGFGINPSSTERQARWSSQWWLSASPSVSFTHPPLLLLQSPTSPSAPPTISVISGEPILPLLWLQLNPRLGRLQTTQSPFASPAPRPPSASPTTNPSCTKPRRTSASSKPSPISSPRSLKTSKTVFWDSTNTCSRMGRLSWLWMIGHRQLGGWHMASWRVRSGVSRCFIVSMGTLGWILISWMGSGGW